MEPEQLTKYFAYLDKLRSSGVTNMFGASAFVQKIFACGGKEADEVIGLWMETFGKGKLSERVQMALQEQQPRESDNG